MNACAACDCADPTALPGLAAECECACHASGSTPTKKPGPFDHVGPQHYAPKQPTRAAFLAEYERALVATYGPGTSYPWAADPAKLARFMGTVRTSLETRRTLWDWNAPCVRQAWKAIGAVGRMTFHGLCNLP